MLGWSLGAESSLALNQPGLGGCISVCVLSGHKDRCMGTLPCDGSSVTISVSDVASMID